MRVLLIGANVAQTPYAVYPLGLGMVATALKSGGHEVQQFDWLQSDQSMDALSRVVVAFQPNLIGLSLRNIDNVNLLNEHRYLDAVQGLVEGIRRISEAPIVLGGSGFSLMPEAILRAVGADYGIVGEGERLVLELAEKLDRKEALTERCLRAKAPMRGEEIPSASYDPDIMRFYLERGGIAAVQTKRGCVRECVYCTYPHLEGHAIRSRDPDRVIEDLERLVRDLGARYIFFTDSAFNDGAGQYLALVHRMKERGVSAPWTAFFTPVGLSDEDVALMKDTGLKAAEIGSDAASEATLRGLRKGFLFEDILRTHDLFLRHGIAVAHYFMFGGPGESRESVIQGIENIRRLEKGVTFAFMGIRILPGTPLCRLAQEQGLIRPDEDLIEPKYYISPEVDRAWMEETLTQAFKGMRNVIFPPDALDDILKFLHKLGYAGSLWDLLLQSRSRERRRARGRERGPDGE